MTVNFWYWLRAFILCCGLVATIIAIRQLDRTKKPVDLSKTMNLCPTRVSAIEFKDGPSIVQEGLTWYRKIDGRMEELDPVAVEKWFSRHCRLKADRVNASGSGVPLLRLAFVSGPPAVLQQAGDGIYAWMGSVFQSDDVNEALQSLKNLPIRLRPSR